MLGTTWIQSFILGLMRQLTMLEQRVCGSNVKMDMTVQAVPKKGKWPIDGQKKITRWTLFLGTAVNEKSGEFTVCTIFIPWLISRCAAQNIGF